jgi:aspartyl aminopeptidase
MKELTTFFKKTNQIFFKKFILGKNIKKPPNYQNVIKKTLIFLYSYNTPSLLTNKIIVKKKLNNFKKIQKKNQWASKYKKKKKVFLE